MVQCKVSIKDFVMPRLHIKIMTKYYTASKLGMLLYSEIKLGLAALLREDVNKYLLFKIGIAIMCFGELRHLKILQTEIKDTAINELGSVECPYKTERTSKGFRLKMPD